MSTITPYGFSKFLKSEVDAAKLNIAANQTNITDLQTDTGTLRTDVDALETTVGGLSTDNSALETAINKSDANDDKIKAVLLNLNAYLKAFSLTYEVRDDQDEVVSPPDFDANTTSLNSLEDHAIP
ncbi:MAG: hypothetical protein H6630_08915 [Arcobacter sp.]|nr:hypothetical protein [Arcobacter sp.]